MKIPHAKTTSTVVLLALFLLGGCSQEFKRSVKDFQSNWVGLKRKVTVYSASGEPVRTYEGKIDIEPTEYGNKIKFAHNGNMVLIFNMGVVVEEIK